jgi:hypothetical protein
MLIAWGNARPFEICSLNFTFCPAEAGKFSEFFKGLSRYHPNLYDWSHFAVSLALTRRGFFFKLFLLREWALILPPLDETHNAEVRWG